MATITDSTHHVYDTENDQSIAVEENKGLLKAQENKTEDIEIDENLLFVDDAIERIGLGRFQYQALFAVGVCFAADAMEVLLLSFLSIVLQHEWGLSEEKTAMITSILFLGTMIGTLILGSLADRIGRRPVFILSALQISIAGMTSAFATSYWMLVSCVFLAGFGIGGLTVPYDTLAELLPCEGRGACLNLINYFWSSGCLFVVALAYCILGTEHNGESHGNWRLFVFLCAVPCFISLIVGLCFVPESPRWLCSQGRTDEAFLILRRAAQTNGHSAEAISTILPDNTSIVAEEENSASCCELFEPKWRGITLRLWGVWGGFAFGYYGTVMAVTRVFEHEDHSRSLIAYNDTELFPELYNDTELFPELNQTSYDGASPSYSLDQDQSYEFDYQAIFISTSAELLGSSLAVFLVDRVGRIPLQVISYVIAGISVFSLCAGASLGFPRELLIGFGFFARVFEMTSSCVSWTATAEILSTEIRSTGHSAANAVARIGAMFSPFVVQGEMPIYHIGLIMLCTHAFTVLCVIRLPETAGRSMGANNHPFDNTVPGTDEASDRSLDSDEEASAMITSDTDESGTDS